MSPHDYHASEPSLINQLQLKRSKAIISTCMRKQRVQLLNKNIINVRNIYRKSVQTYKKSNLPHIFFLFIWPWTWSIGERKNYKQGVHGNMKPCDTSIPTIMSSRSTCWAWMSHMLCWQRWEAYIEQNKLKVIICYPTRILGKFWYHHRNE
jgi:hypothetical protein